MAKGKTDRAGGKPDAADQVLIDLAGDILSEYFFDPDHEDGYHAGFAAFRGGSQTAMDLAEMTLELDAGDCELSIDALRTATAFRVSIAHPKFAATIEGLWDFDQEELRKPKIVSRTGSAKAIIAGCDAIFEAIEESDLDGEELDDLMAALGDDTEHPRIGDDPTEPPAATALDRGRVKAIAKKLARNPDAGPNAEDAGWLEEMPQVLPVITDLLIAEASATDKKRDDNLVEAYQDLLTHQLEFVRYRQDAGWDWAIRMLSEYQQRLIALGEAKTIPQQDWFAMAGAMTQARVPVSEDVQVALASAGFTPEDVEPTDDMVGMLRGFLDQMAGMVSSAEEVIEGLKSSAAMMPGDLRSFLATEMALSPHQVLRDAVPLMLLDSDPAVRRNAALALEQSAHPETLSPDALRRAITVRNWLPPADRPALDSAIRKARLAGVEIGRWPAPSAVLEFHATMIDGSGAQSLLAVDRAGKKGVFAGLLLRHGEGIADAWGQADVARRDINTMLREAKLQGTFVQVRKSYLDMMAQHAIGTAVEAGTAPPDGLLTFAELAGGADWKDRRLDIAEEAERMWLELPAEARTANGVAAAFARGLDWMQGDQIILSWFEDGPKVRDALASFARNDRAGMMAVVLSDILPATRAEWAERFVLMAMWCEGAIDAKYRERAADLIPVAHALVGDTPMAEIPVMEVIAEQTLMAVISGAW
ncbi:MAG TPA: hypothetical protein DDZ81_01550 [Acetobacteraceae bacterium]|jgi:hypothetical protein|nr:hypothetical protein [Acetobacteraceae bacterium]